MILMVILEREIQKKKKRSKRTESSIKDYHCPLLTDDTIKKSHRRSDCSRINTLSKKDQSKPLTVCMDINTISQGWAITQLRNLKVKEKAQIINSVESKCLNSRGNLAAKIDFNRRQTYIEDIFVVLHFAKSPQHFSYQLLLNIKLRLGQVR